MNDTTHVTSWLVEGLPSDVQRSIDRISQSDDVQRVAVMPDVHLANDVCVGTAVATSRLIYPAAVGADIGCGMSALAFDTDAGLLDDAGDAARVLHGLGRVIPINRHGPGSMPDRLDSSLVESLSHPRLQTTASRDGRVQLGTLGRGNHFVELQADEANRLWLMLHSGSRGFGQAITKHHLEFAERSSTGLDVFDSTSKFGRAYLDDVEWAIAYAEANRRAMAEAVVALLETLFEVAPDWSTWLDCHHDHVRRERHGDDEWWVHRKGALPADDGLLGIIPGSMGTRSFHVVGRGCEASLRSSSHGAGRQLHRTEAKRRIGARQLEREMDGVWFNHRLRHRLRDEAPSAYKDVHAVLRAQRDLTRVVRELRPRLVYKGA